MLEEFSARTVSTEILEHLERRRPAIAGDEALVTAEIQAALVPVRQTYLEYELPAGYLDALCDELSSTLPARWRPGAAAFTRLEQGGFGLWRGGDLVARLAYVFAGLCLGGLVVAAPFIPIWEKWFPFALALAAWWLPDLQIRWHRRRYARALGDIVMTFDRAQPALDRHITIAELTPAKEETR